MAQEIPAVPPSPSSRAPVFTLLLGLAVIGLFVTLGTAAQLLSVPWGLWFSELFVFLLTPAVAIRWTGRDPWAAAGLRFAGLVPLLVGLLLGAANYFLAVIPLQLFSQSLSPEWLEELFDLTRLFRHATEAELVVLSTGVIVAAPVCEEFFFRGVLQRGLHEAHVRPAVAIGLTALVFSTLHADPIGFLARLQLGFLFGWLFWKGQSLWPAIGAHAANNLVSLALYFALGDGADAELAWYWALPMAALGIGAMAGALTLLGRRRWLEPTRAVEDVPLPPANKRLLVLVPLSLASLALTGMYFADPRGAALNRVDLLHPLKPLSAGAPPEEKSERERLEALRRQARRGEIPVEAYEAERRRLSREGPAQRNR